MPINIDAVKQDPEFQEYQRTDPDGAAAMLSQFQAENSGTLPAASPAPTAATGLPVVRGAIPPPPSGPRRLAWGPQPPQPLTPTQEWTARQMERGARYFPGAEALGVVSPTGPPDPWVRGIAAHTPETPENYAIDTATLLAMLGTAGSTAEIPGLAEMLRASGFAPEIGGVEGVPFAAARRVALPTVAGGVTGAIAHPEDPMGGFMAGSTKGAVTGLGGEALAFPVGWAGRKFGKAGVLGRYIENTGVNLQAVLENPIGDVPGTEIKVGPLNDQKAWSDAFLGRNPYAVKNAANAMNSYDQYVQSQIGNTLIPVQLEKGAPPVSKTFTEWEDEIEHWEDLGRTPKGKESGRLGAKDARGTASVIRQSVAGALDKQFPALQDGKLGTNWATFRRRFGAIKDISRYVSEHGMTMFLKPEEAQANMLKAFGEGDLAVSMKELLGKDSYDQFMYAVKSGLRNPRLPGMEKKGYTHWGFHAPRLTPGETHKPVGIQPWWIYPPRAPFYGMASPASWPVWSWLGRQAMSLPLRVPSAPAPPPEPNMLIPQMEGSDGATTR